MMNARGIALALCAVLALLVFAIPATSEPEQNIIVDGAAVIIETSVSVEQGLVDSIAVAGPRVVVEYANHLQSMDLPSVPDPLQTLLDQVSERVVAEYANEILRENLEPIPADLQVLLEQVTERVVFQYANVNLEYSLHYPRDLVDDTTPPEMPQDESQVGISPIAANGLLTITWTTDEFADSTIVYGTTSGSYPHTVSDPLYVKEHALGLPGLMQGETYYYKLSSTDLSDNTATTPEFSFTAKQSLFLYLPLVVRNGP